MCKLFDEIVSMYSQSVSGPFLHTAQTLSTPFRQQCPDMKSLRAPAISAQRLCTQLTISLSSLTRAFWHKFTLMTLPHRKNYQLPGHQRLDSIRAPAKRMLPAHLVFDITKTQIASSRSKQRARVPTPAEPQRGFKNEAGWKYGPHMKGKKMLL